jgi:hypothetical protein
MLQVAAKHSHQRFPVGVDLKHRLVTANL